MGEAGLTKEQVAEKLRAEALVLRRVADRLQLAAMRCERGEFVTALGLVELAYKNEDEAEALGEKYCEFSVDCLHLAEAAWTLRGATVE